MKRCSNCGHENAQASMYCENCGTLLAAQATSDPTYRSTYDAYASSGGERSITTQEQPYYSEVPPPPSYPILPHPAYSYDFPSPNLEIRKRRGFGAAVLSTVLYLIGAFSAVFGVSGFMLYHTSNTLVGTVFVLLLIVALVVLVLLLIVRKQLVLKGWVRVLIALGIIIIGFIALIVVAALSHADSEYTSFGIIFLICGFAIAVVAFW